MSFRETEKHGETDVRLTPETMFKAMQDRLPILIEDNDAWLRRMMAWHFSEETGSPYWLSRKAALPFDPLKDVQCMADIALFGLFDKSTLRTVQVQDLVPQGFQSRPRRIFETGGTTGRPCRIVDVTTGEYNRLLYHTMLEARQLLGGDALGMVPSGPHAYGTFVVRLLDGWAGHAHLIDFDPRWVKRMISQVYPIRITLII